MSAIETFLRQPTVQVMGWALLHFLWQGALLGVLTAGALALLRRSAADVRYVVATIALSLMLTLPMVTALQLWRGQQAADGSGRQTPAACCDGAVAAAPSTPAVPEAVDSAAPLAPAPAFLSGRIQRPNVESWLPIFVLVWLCGVAILTLRLLSGWLWVQRMKSHAAAPAGEGWQRIGERLSRRLHITRRVRLLESKLVDVPTVIGWMKPVVLLPASALAGLAPEQLEAILAHELAHIRRHDYLVNLLQTLVETMLFYHPAVWWLSRRIRIERENCCDDLAVSLCGDPYTYARALADLEELRGTSRLVLAANGGSLVMRVRRLLGAPTHAGRAPGWLAGSATVLVMLGIAAGAAGTDAFQASTASPATPPVAAAPSSQPPASAAVVTPATAAAGPATATSSLEAVAALQARAAAALQDSAAVPPRVHPMTAAELQSALSAADAFESQAREMLHAELSRTEPIRAQTARASVFVDAAAVLASAVPDFSVAFSAPGQNHATFSWSNNGERLEVKYDGEVEFTDDDTDVKRLSPGGLLRIRDGRMFASHTIEFATDPAGNVTRRYWSGMSERPFEPEGRQWLAGVLPRFIRQTGIGAQARVARILKAKGPAGVLAEIGLIEGSWGKRVYFTHLLKATTLDSATVRQVLAQASREIDSDFELASLLIESADRLLVDDAARQAYFEASRSIQSDFEMRRVYAAALKRGPVSGPVLASILDASRNIESDFEQASLLIQVAELQPLDTTTRAPFFTALATVDSDFEHRRVLTALAKRTDITPETANAMLESNASVQSDFESASFLLDVVKQQPIEGALRASFFRAVEGLGSSFERGRVLQAVVRRPDVSNETLLAVLRATAGMNGSFEASQVLLAMAAGHTISGPARDAYIDAAEKLGDFEQGKVLSALVKNERRK